MYMQAVESFERSAADYDRARRALVNCQDQLYRHTVAEIPAEAERILELGAGTGLLSAAVAEAFPRAALVLVDAAPAMLSQARQRLSGHARLHCELMDYAAALPTGPFDAVLSSLSIHHLTDADKQQLFGRVLAALTPGGVFVNADQVLGPTPEIEREYQRIWEQQARQAGVTEADLQAALERQKLDISAPLIAQLRWLEEAGFCAVDCLFKDYRFAVMKGQKRSE